MTVYQVKAKDWSVAAPLTSGDTFRVAQTGDALEVVASTPLDRILYVNVDDPAILARLAARGVIENDYRTERSDFGPRLYDARYALTPDKVPPMPAERDITADEFMPRDMGDTWSRHLEDVNRLLEAVNYGEGGVFINYDTGCDVTHPDLTEVIAPTQDDGVDHHGHGTFTASQQAGKRGMLKNARLVSIKVLTNPDGSGTESGIINALHRGLDYWRYLGTPPAASNNSWGSDSGSSGIDAAFRFCHQNGLMMTNAQGNSGMRVQSPGTPTRVARFVAGAIDREGAVAPFTSGLDTWAVTTAFYCGVQEWGAAKGGGYTTSDGTSMADPWLTCAVLMCRLAHPDWVEEQILSYILTHAQGLPVPARNGKGRGVIGVDIIPSQAQPDPPAPAPEPEPGPTPAPVAGIPQDVFDELAEVVAIVGRTQAARGQLAGYLGPIGEAILEETFREVGAIKNYVEHCAAMLGRQLTAPNPEVPPVAPEPPPAPPPTPRPPPVRIALARGRWGQAQYGNQSSRQVYNYFIPQGARDCMVIIHGGEWRSGDPSIIPMGIDFRIGPNGVLEYWQPGILDDSIKPRGLDFHVDPREVNNFFITRYNMAVVLPAYRLGRVEECAEDISALIAHLRQTDLPMRKFVLSGHSAGGHLSALIAQQSEWHQDVDAVISYAGAALQIDSAWANHPFSQHLTAWPRNPNEWQRFSPSNYAGTAPTLVVYGLRDDQVPYQQPQRFIAKLKQNGQPVMESAQPNGDHFSVANPALNVVTAQAVEAFYGAYLR